MSTFQDWMDEAIRRAGGQSQLARLVAERYNIKCSQQSIEYLARRTGKPAKGSRLTPKIAAVVSLDPDWAGGTTALASTPARAQNISSNRAKPVAAQKRDHEVIERATEVEGMELTKDAIALVKAWMDLPRNERDDFKRKIETASLRHTAYVPDQQLHDLAAPTSSLRRGKAKTTITKQRKTRAGTQ